MPTWLSLTEFEQIDVFFNVCLRGKASKNLLRDISPIRGGGSTPLPLEKSTFFRTQYALNAKPFLFKPFFCIVTPVLSTGSKEVFIKMGEKS